MKSDPQISVVWIAAIVALALASLGLQGGRPMVADLDLPAAEASE